MPTPCFHPRWSVCTGEKDPLWALHPPTGRPARWFRLGSSNGDGTADKTEGVATNGVAPHAKTVRRRPTACWWVEKPGVNGTSSRANVAAGKIAHTRLVEVEVAHQVPGRIRLTIPRLEHDAKFAQRLAVDVMALPDVHRARVSPSSRSLVVEYHHQVMNVQRRAAILPQVIECIRVAAGADGVRDAAPEREQTAAAVPHVDLVARLALPAASLGLSAGMLAGVAVPPVLMGGLVLPAARPIFGRASRSAQRAALDGRGAGRDDHRADGVAGQLPGAVDHRQCDRKLAGGPRLDGPPPPADQPGAAVAAGATDAGRQLSAVGAASWAEIEPGDELLLSAGDLIPADGLVLAGRALIDQQRLTGDAWPVAWTGG